MHFALKSAFVTISTVAALGAALGLAAPAMADHHQSADHAEGTAAHAALVAAVGNAARGEAAQRDQFRHPVETLEFFRVEPGMTIVDMYPGEYYTDILVPYLGSAGSYIASAGVVAKATEEQKASMRAFPEKYLKESAQALAAKGLSGASIASYVTDAVPANVAGTVDRVLVFRMMHNFHRWGIVHDQLSAYRAMLKDDGLMGIVQHRAKADAPYSYTDGNNGYMRQEDVIKLVEAHGFELVGTSEINANPKDTADHKGGVWQIPPRWASKDENLKAIGESDRMTLLFRKRP